MSPGAFMRAKEVEIDGAMRSLYGAMRSLYDDLMRGIDVDSLDRWHFDAAVRRSALRTLWAWLRAEP